MSGDDQTRYTLWAALEREAKLEARVAELTAERDVLRSELDKSYRRAVEACIVVCESVNSEALVPGPYTGAEHCIKRIRRSLLGGSPPTKEKEPAK